MNSAPRSARSRVGPFIAACAVARAVAKAGLDAGLTDAARGERVEGLAASAVKLLRRALEKGLGRVVDMREDPDLDPLRQRADYLELMNGVDAAGRPAPK